jgi:dTMP kinase
MARPLLVAFEGVDGAGKSLALQGCAEALRARGQDCLVLREPGGTRAGEELRAILLERDLLERDALLEALLFSASRRQLVLERIAPALAAGQHVLLDRSFLSTWVYQGLAADPRHAVPLERLEEWTRLVHGEFWPDAILLLDLPDEDAARRRAKRRGPQGPDRTTSTADGMESRGEEFLSQVAASFRTLAQRDPDWIRVIDARPAPEELRQACLSELDRLLAERGRQAETESGPGGGAR